MKQWNIGLVENESKYRQIIESMFRQDERLASFTAWNSAEEFLRDKQRDRVDLLFVDIRLSFMDGVELVRIFHQTHPAINIVMLTVVDTEQTIFRALRYGAIGYLLKSDLGEIVEYTEMVMNGGAAINPAIALRVLQSFHAAPPGPESPRLTPREEQILKLLVEGQTNRAVAEFFGISENTMRSHVKNIYRKLGVKNKVELTHWAFARGMGEFPGPRAPTTTDPDADAD